MIKHKLLTGLFCLFQLVFFAQNAAKDLEMEYDKKTGLLFSELPFDVNFNLKVKIDINDTIDSILYKNTNKNNGVIRLRSRFQFKKRTNEKELNFYIKPIEGNIKEKYLVLEMDPLAPKTRYEIIIRKKFSSDILKEITKIYDLFKKNEDGNAILKKIFKKEVKISNDSTLKDEKTRKFYQSLYDEIKSNTVGDNFKNDKTAIEIYKQYFEILKLKYGTNNISSILKTKNNDTYKITAYKNIYDAKFKGEYDNLDVSEFDNNEIINELINTTTLVRILYLFKEGKEVYADAKKFESSLKLISNLKSLKNKLILEILEGKGTLFHNSDDELISEFDLFNRINNIKLNTTILTNYIEDLKSIRLFGSFKTDLDVDIEVVIKNLKNLILIFYIIFSLSLVSNPSLGDFKEYDEIDTNDIIVDAIFGIGLNRPVQSWIKELFIHFKKTQAFTLSVDIPSGLYTDKAVEDEDAVVYAGFTLSFATPKLVFFLPETAKYTVQWEVLDIGLDPEFLSTTQTSAELIGKHEVLPNYVPRDKFSHKGNNGHALIIGGSYGKIGAVILTSRAALSAGSGLISAYVPKCGYIPLQASFPEGMHNDTYQKGGAAYWSAITEFKQISE